MKKNNPFYHRDDHGCGCGGCHGGEKHHEHHEHCCDYDHHEVSASHGPDCTCEICRPYAAFCDTCGKSLAECTCAAVEEGIEKAVYLLENLGCANCAAKMERKIKELPGVRHVCITFATKQMRLSAEDHGAVLPQIREICASIEPDVKVVHRAEAEKAKATSAVEQKKTSFWKKEGNKDIAMLIIGGVFFIAALICSALDVIALPLYIIAYLVLGYDILFHAVKNMVKGHVLDENFLMAIASLGAFIIGEYTEAVAVVLFFCIGEIFEERAVARSRSQIMDAVDMRPETVQLLKGDATREIPAAEAAVGDVLLVRPGDRIPLDGVVVEGESRVDTSPVTGEPVPVAVAGGDKVISGCINSSGVLKIRVEKVLEESMVTRILNSVEQAAASKPKIDRFITRFARVYTPCVVLLAVATAVIPSLITGEWSHWIYTALTFLVISCPCALVLSVPLAYFSGIGYGSRRGILFKGGVVLEALKSVRAVVMDKTGTVTKGCFSVTRIHCANGFDENTILSVAAAGESASTHPIGASIVAAAGERKLTVDRPEEIREIAGRGIAAKLKGSEILCGSRGLLHDNGVAVSVEHHDFNGTEVYIAIDGVFAGVIGISDIIKSDAKAAVADMNALGLSTVMLTGDRKESAAAVTAETGISAYRAELMPQDKLTAIEDIRQNSGGVMFVGDGINDAPVLAGADVGAAMGSGADAAIEAADVVFMTSEMKAVPVALKIARKVGRVAAQNVAFALLVKFAVMVLGLLGFANMWFAIFADTGVAMICILNSIRILYGTIR